LLVNKYYTGGLKSDAPTENKYSPEGRKSFWKRLSDKLTLNPNDIGDYHTIPSLATAGVGLM